MLKKLILILSISLLNIFLLNNNIFSEGEEEVINSNQINIESEKVEIEKLGNDLIKPYEKELKNPIHIDNSKSIQVSGLQDNLAPYDGVSVECIFSDKVVKPNDEGVCEYKFETVGFKNSSIQFVQELEGEDPQVVFTFSFEILIYNKSISSIIDHDMFKGLRKIAGEQGIYLYEIGDSSNLDSKTIINNINKYNSLEEEGKSDYIFIATNTDSEISFLNIITPYIGVLNDKYSMILSNNDNINIRSSLINKFINGKYWINKIILTDKLSHSVVLSESNFIDIRDHLRDNSYPIVEFSSDSNIEIPKYLFLSDFINNLGNSGASLDIVQLFMQVIFLVLLITVFKHVIGLGGLGIFLPALLSLTISYNSNYWSLLIFSVIILFNIGVFKILKKYVLLYTPKIAFVILLDIFLLIILVNILSYLGIFISDSISLISLLLMVLMLEKLVGIMGSKIFVEYKTPLFNTIIIAVICGTLFMIPLFNRMLIIYPEVLLFTPTLALLLAKWGGLRLTEYFRFREIIGNIEEEE